jgi:hypothetical protein
MNSSEELTPWPDLDEGDDLDDLDVGGKYNKEEEKIISSYYYNLNKRIFNFMGCNAKKGQLLITCENLLRLMAELLLDYEHRVRDLPGGHLTDNNLISPKLYKSLREPFLHCKMVKLYPHLYTKKRYGEYVLKEVGDDELPELLRIGEKDELIHQMGLIALTRKMKTKDILEKVVSDTKKKMNDKGEGLKLFFMKKESSKLSKTASKPFEELDSPIYSGSNKKKKKKKKPTKKKKKPTKKKKNPTKKKKS